MKFNACHKVDVIPIQFGPVLSGTWHDVKEQ